MNARDHARLQRSRASDEVANLHSKGAGTFEWRYLVPQPRAWKVRLTGAGQPILYTFDKRAAFGFAGHLQILGWMQGVVFPRRGAMHSKIVSLGTDLRTYALVVRCEGFSSPAGTRWMAAISRSVPDLERFSTQIQKQASRRGCSK